MILLAFLIAIIWGSKSIALSIITKKYSTEFIYSIQIILELLFISFFIYFNKDIIYPDLNNITLIDFISMFFIALIGTFLSNYLFTYLLKYNDHNVITTIAYSAPIFTLIISMVFLNKKIDLVKQIGVLLSVVGLVMVSQ